MKPNTFLTTRETAQALGIGLRHVLTLLYEGKLPGAKKQKRTWMVPASAVVARLKSHDNAQRKSGAA
jgi:excisionase family DNA binding protein